MTNHHEDPEIFAEGVLEIAPDGHGFLRSPDYNYLPAADDIYVSPAFINTFNLKTGDTIAGSVLPPTSSEHYFTLARIDGLNNGSLERLHPRREFHNLKKVDSRERLRVETTRENLCGRVIDLMVPLGKGHSGLIVSSPHSGERMLIETIANGIATNYPNLTIYVVLIGEQLEEAGAMNRSLRAEVFFSTQDEPEARHIQLAEIVFEKAKRLVEQGRDVIVIVDSLSRLICAYNAVVPHSDDGLEVGVDPAWYRRARNYLSAAGKFQDGGSLTVIATVEAGTTLPAKAALPDMENWADVLIMLDRQVLNDGIFPAVNIHDSRNAREELLLPKEDLDRIWVVRKVLSSLSAAEAVKTLGSKLLATGSNVVFLKNPSSL